MGWRSAFTAPIVALTLAAPAQAANYTVNGAGDGGTCSGTTCPSIRAAIAAAEVTTGADTITVPAGVVNIGNDLVVNSNITITGANARTTIVDGGAKYRPFRVTTTGVLTLRSFTLRNGQASVFAADGGGLYNQGSVSLTDVRITGNRAPDGRGGGIANNLGLITADNLLVDNNVAASGGGGIHNIAGQELPAQDGWLALTDTTIVKNTSSGIGGVGGLASTGNGALIGITRWTVADNVGGVRGVGGIVPSGNTQATASIVARNLANGEPSNCSVKLTDNSFNVEDGTDCGLAPGNLKPVLATALSDQGGQLDVLTITTAGDAFNRLPSAQAACTGSDQRGLARPQGTACDAGAFEIEQAATVTITGGPSGTITSTGGQFDFQASDPAATVQCDLTGPGQTPGFETCAKSNAQPYSDLADGPYTFSVRAATAAFPNPTVATRSFVVNAAGAPNTTITGGPTGVTNTNPPTFTFTSSEQGSTFQCRFDGGTFTTCTTPFTPAALGQGAHTFEVRAIDAAGSVDATPASRAFTIDTVAPDTTIGSGPSGATASTTATFTFTSNEAGVTFQCALDGTAFGACPVSYTGLTQGSHTFQVRAVDAAGNLDASPAARSWTVDTIAPTVTVDASPARTNDTTPSFTFSANEAGVSFQCRTDAGTFATCASPYTTAILTEGTHSVDVRATDAAGNQGAAANRSIVIDTTAPAAPTISAGPTGPTNDNTPTFSFTGEAGASFQCRVGAAAFAACTSPHTTAQLADGAATFAVRAIDAAGNVGAGATRGFTVDTATPDTTITAGPQGLTASTSASFTYASNETGATFQCALDGAAFAACPASYTGLTQGAHTFSVRATDTAGNVDPTPATRSWTVDTAPPAIPLINTSSAAGSTVTLSGTTDPGTTIELFDGATTVGAAQVTGQGWTRVLDGIADGTHTYTARARDAAGNTSGASTPKTLVVDTGPPAAPELAGPSGPTNDATPTFTFTGESGATFECSHDDTRFATCASPATASALGDGPHTFRVVAIDAAGNRGAVATRTFTVDTTEPTPAVTGGPDGATSEPSPAFAFTAAEATTECKLDGPGGPGAYAACASPKTFGALAPGAYVFFLRATDTAGNQSVTERAFTVTQALQAQPTPTPTPSPSATPPPVPTPVGDQVIVVAPATGTVLVKQKGQKTFEPLDVTRGIPLGSEVDVRKGRVTLTSRPKAGAPAETADFYGGLFIVTQKGGITDLKLSEKLTGCPKGQQASLSAKKPKSRKLWGDGKGAFRTSGKYSAATVRGTRWLVQDTCTTTLTQVKQGVVQVQDFTAKKKLLLKAPKKYTAKAKKR